MRTKDIAKRKALFYATIKIVNEIGFAYSSISKIAKEAKVSSATIYVYYKNKEDLLISTYIEIKIRLSQAILKDFDDTLPIRDILKNVWINLAKYITNNTECYKFMEQFSHSPYSSLVDMKKVEKHFEPLMEVLERGIKQKVLKNIPHYLFVAFMWHPLISLANPRSSLDSNLTKEDLEIAFSMAWDAIRL